MFEKFRKKETSIYDEQIAKVKLELDQYTTDAPEYEKALNQLERLTKLKVETTSKPVSHDALVGAAASILGILVIIGYEQKHVMGSKATGFIIKPK